MSLIIREFIDQDFYQNTKDYEAPGLSLSEADKTADKVDPDSLMVEIEGIHALPFVTRNYTRYTPRCLKNSVPSWTSPYRRPLIRHHNEKDGEIIGRVVRAEYKSRDTLSGTPALLFTVNIPGEQTKKDVSNGIHSTTSIGVIAHDVRCSICGRQLASGEMCEHERGAVYDTESGPQTCCWDIHDMEAKELSYVIVPSDMYSKNIAVYPAAEGLSTTAATIKESYDNAIIPDKGEKEMPKDNDPLTEAGAKISDLETRLKEMSEAADTAKGELAEMTEEKNRLETRLSEAALSRQELEAKYAETEQAKNDFETRLAGMAESCRELEAKLAEEAALREGLETMLSEARAATKKSLIETVMTMRRALGCHEISSETIMERTEESLRDSITDLKEELQKKAPGKEAPPENAVPAAGSVADPTLPSPDSHELKESAKKAEKIDLRCGLQNIFASVLSAHQ